MKKYFKTFMICLAGILGLVFFNTLDVKAAQTPAQPVINYSVTPIQSQYQFDKKVTYFDLKVTPNQKLSVSFKINNNDTKTHTYTVMINRASTDTNGVIAYNDSKVEPDKSLKYDIQKLVSYPKKVSVGPKTSKEVTVNINAPSGTFNGVVLGGILVEQDDQVNKKNPKGVTIKNKYNYVLGLQLLQNTKPVKANLKFIKAYETTKNGQVFVNALLDNDVPRIESGVQINSKVTDSNQKVVLQSKRANMDLAPNSYFNYPVNINTVVGTNKNKRLKPGTYQMTLNIKANNGKDIWNLQRKFTVTSQETKAINKKTPVDRGSKDLIIGIIAGLVVISGLVIWYYRKHKLN
ncbi:DUF916 and DUF3324 domain-containing protein [Companilactobacillus sp. HBUAS59544]|uniref:DUF916 and DUF3324 domain-containing protein n=1 Tax=Companilactobacillus sp. HBUAS59544 TaxID=3109363 RepID=UPI002FF0C122